jgi:succinate dehydrogenase / fumarate reductase iron-sulfur subunit
MNFHLKIWRQRDAKSPGELIDVEARDIPSSASFLEMLDIINEEIVQKGEEPIAHDSDCREGICGTCSLTINGIPHGNNCKGIATCQLHMRTFRDGETIYVEPFRVRAFPILRDLIVDRSALDRIIQAGGYISARTGSAPDANAAPVPKFNSDLAMDAAACIGCGACAAACPNGSAMLFASAKMGQLSLLPQGQPERGQRTLAMVRAMDKEGFGNCSNVYNCSAVCPKEISSSFIARMNREYMLASLQEGLSANPVRGGGD